MQNYRPNKKNSNQPNKKGKLGENCLWKKILNDAVINTDFKVVVQHIVIC